MPPPPQPGRTSTTTVCSSIRSGGTFTAWANSWLRGAVSYDAAVSAIRGAGIGTVRGLLDHPEPNPLGWGLSAVRASGGTPLRLVLPVAGDIRGVPPIAELVAAATRAGQLVIGSGLAFVPDVDPSADGGWLAFDVRGGASDGVSPGAQQTVAQAEGSLRLAVLQATDTLAALDVARWNPGVESLGRGEQALLLPPDHEPKAAALAGRALQFAAILDLAQADAPGAAINARSAAHRETALRPLSVAVREALMTAYSAIPVRRTVDR